MAKKTRTKSEQALYDIKLARKMINKAATNLESRINSLENHCQYIEEENENIKKEYDATFQEIFGKNKETYLEGFRFERHVVWWMNQYFGQYDLKIWQGDKCYKPYENSKRISPSWNTYPDLIYMHKNGKKIIAFECKYRFNGKLTIDDRQFENYINFEKQIKTLMNIDVKVYVMVGTSGQSDKPAYMYCLPINCFDNQQEIDMRTVPQYKVMERNIIGQEIRIFKENIPF